MENKEPYDLSEAIKKTYQAEPLKTDLAFAVTIKLFAKKKAPIADKLLHILFYCLIISAASYCLYYLVSAASFAIIMLFLLVAGGFLWVAFREMNFYKMKSFHRAADPV